MQIKVSSYISGSSCVHGCDARVKIILLAAYSVTLFMLHTWTGLFACSLILGAFIAASGIRLERFFGLLFPVYILASFTIVVNAFSIDAVQAALAGAPSGLGNVSAGVMGTWSPVVFWGTFGFVPAGFARGCFFAARIVLLVVGSLLVTYTTTSTQMTSALSDFMRPLRAIKVPVDDVATVFSIALRFIPVTAEEFGRVFDAQAARGAGFSVGSVWQRLSAWQTVMIPLFVGLFRRADSLANAMDARCYGLSDQPRTALENRAFAHRDAAMMLVGLAALGTLAVLL